MKKFILGLGLVLGCQVGFSQDSTIDAAHIKSVILKPVGANRYVPIIRLGETLNLSFDDLIADEHDYRFRIEHCDYNWEPTKLINSEFIDGYAEDRIKNYENSFNTLQPYTNYQLTIPNRSTRIKISGNYKIHILDEEDTIVCTRRFVVFEPRVTVGVAIFKSRDIAQIETKQAVEFTINNPTFRINNPGAEIVPVILQNNNWQTAIVGLKPQFFRGTQLLYKYNKETSFWAGNEFLYFDSKSIRNSTLNIANVELGRDVYQTYLYTNHERIDQPYTLFPDINGNFSIRILGRDNPQIEADYSWVHFSLKSLENLDGKEVYVSGSFNDWQLSSMNKMTYNNDTGFYEVSMLLKQGFYNYQYLTKSKNNTLSNYDIDGSFYQTENDYTVLVYYKKMGSRYTKVIGVGYGNSEKINN